MVFILLDSLAIPDVQEVTEDPIETWSDGTATDDPIPAATLFSSFSSAVRAEPTGFLFNPSVPVGGDSWTAGLPTLSGTHSTRHDITVNDAAVALSVWLFAGNVSLATAPARVEVRIQALHRGSPVPGSELRMAVEKNASTLGSVPNGNWAVSTAAGGWVDADVAGGIVNGLCASLDGRWELRGTTVPYPGQLRASGAGSGLGRSPDNQYRVTVTFSSTSFTLFGNVGRLSSWMLTPLNPLVGQYVSDRRCFLPRKRR